MDEQNEDLVADEVAEREFERFVEAMDLDVAQDAMDEEDRKDFSNQKRLFLREVKRGKLSVDEQGQPVFRPSGCAEEQALTFHEPVGANFVEMDRYKESQSVKKTNALLDAMTKTSPKRFASMKNRDYKVCAAIMAFFLGG